MAQALESEEYQKLFRKEAEEKCPCPPSCNCKAKGTHSLEECPCPEEKKEASEEEKETSLKQSFEALVNNFVSLSEKLDDLGFNKTSARVLNSFDVFLKEAAGEDIEQMLERSLEELSEAGDVDIDVELKDPPEVQVSTEKADPRLLEEEPAGEAMDLEQQLRAIEELGLESPEGPLSSEQKKEMKERGLGGLSQEIAEANRKADELLTKMAQEGVSFEADSELEKLLSQAEEEDEEESEDFEDED